MASEVELERMLVRLVGDASQFEAMIRGAVQTTQQGADQLAAATRQAADEATRELAKVGTAPAEPSLPTAAFDQYKAAVEEAVRAHAEFSKSFPQLVSVSEMEQINAKWNELSEGVRAYGEAAGLAGQRIMNDLTGARGEADALTTSLRAAEAPKGAEIPVTPVLDVSSLPDQVRLTAQQIDDAKIFALHIYGDERELRQKIEDASTQAELKRAVVPISGDPAAYNDILAEAVGSAQRFTAVLRVEANATQFDRDLGEMIDEKERARQIMLRIWGDDRGLRQNIEEAATFAQMRQVVVQITGDPTLFDRVMMAAKGDLAGLQEAQDAYNAKVLALGQLLDRNLISQEQYNAAVTALGTGGQGAADAYATALDNAVRAQGELGASFGRTVDVGQMNQLNESWAQLSGEVYAAGAASGVSLQKMTNDLTGARREADALTESLRQEQTAARMGEAFARFEGALRAAADQGLSIEKGQEASLVLTRKLMEETDGLGVSWERGRRVSEEALRGQTDELDRLRAQVFESGKVVAAPAALTPVPVMTPKDEKELDRQAEAVKKAVATAQERYNAALAQYNTLVSTGRITTEEYSRAVSKATDELTRSESKTRDTAVAVSGLVASYVGLRQLKGAFSAFANLEAVQMRLTASVEAHGGSVSRLIPDYEAFAKAQAGVTTSSRTQIMELLQLAESYGVTGDAAKTAVREALALAAAKGTSAKAIMMMTARLAQGETAMLGRYLPGLRNIKDETQRVSKAHEMLAAMSGVAQAEFNSSRGQVAKLGNELVELKASFGALIADAINPLVQILREVVNGINEMPPVVKGVLLALSSLALGILAVNAAGKGLRLALGLLFGKELIAAKGIVATLSDSLFSLATLKLVGAVAGVIAVGAAVVYVRDKYAELSEEVQFNKKAMEESRSTHEMLLKKQGEVIDDLLDRAKRIEERPVRIRVLTNDIYRASRQVFSLHSELAETQREIDKMKNAPGPLFGLGPGRELGRSTLGLTSEYDKAKGREVELKQRLEAARAGMARLTEERDKSINPAVERKHSEAAEKLVKRLKEEADMMGVTGHEAEVMRLKLEGASESQVAAARAAVMASESRRLQTELDTFAMDEEAKKAYEMERADERRRKTMEAMGKELKDLESISKMLSEHRDDRLFGSPEKVKAELDELAGEYNQIKNAMLDMEDTAKEIASKETQLKMFRAVNKALDENHKSMEEGNRLTKHFLSPQEKFTEQMKELDTLFAKGAVGPETYLRAVESAVKDLEQAASKLNQELQKLEGIQFGSAAGVARLNEWREAMRTDRLNPILAPTKPADADAILKRRGEIEKQIGPAPFTAPGEIHTDKAMRRDTIKAVMDELKRTPGGGLVEGKPDVEAIKAAADRVGKQSADELRRLAGERTDLKLPAPPPAAPPPPGPGPERKPEERKPVETAPQRGPTPEEQTEQLGLLREIRDLLRASTNQPKINIRGGAF